MRVFAEFVGGPLDGELRLMPDARSEWRVPLPNFNEVIYHAVARRAFDTPTGDPVVLFEVHS